MVLGKVLQVHVVSGDSKNPFAFKNGKKQYKFINWKRLFVRTHNEVLIHHNLSDRHNQARIIQEKSAEVTKVQVHKLLSNERKKREALKKAGIEYTFPGFVSGRKEVASLSDYLTPIYPPHSKESSMVLQAPSQNIKTKKKTEDNKHVTKT